MNMKLLLPIVTRYARHTHIDFGRTIKIRSNTKHVEINVLVLIVRLQIGLTARETMRSNGQ
jgi:hypothetical protein